MVLQRASLDTSNVVFDAGSGDWAVGRCTLDFSTGLGLCTFSDGTGPLTGFHARVNLSPAGGGISQRGRDVQLG